MGRFNRVDNPINKKPKKALIFSAIRGMRHKTLPTALLKQINRIEKYKDLAQTRLRQRWRRYVIKISFMIPN